MLHMTSGTLHAERRDDMLYGPSVLSDSGRFDWCSTVIKGDDGKYHMLYSTWESGNNYPPFVDGWLLLSKIAYAVSDYPDKDFTFKKIVLQGRRYTGDSLAWDAVSVHNPHVKKFNGKYYLYYTGSRDPGPQPIGSPGAALRPRDRIQQSQCIGVIEFNNFEELLAGNYKRLDAPILAPRTRVKPQNIINPSPPGTVAKPDNIIVVNPSVVQRPSDRKYLLYFKGNMYDPGWKGVHGVAISDSPTGPFEPMNDYVFNIKNEDGSLASGEDPFVWYYPRYKKFFVILKDFTGKITMDKPGLALLQSKDGFHWERTSHPFFMDKKLKLQNGEIIEVDRLERPQLLLDKNGKPKILYAACSIVKVDPRRDGTSFNIQLPLIVKTK